LLLKKVDNQGGKDGINPAFYFDEVKITEKKMKAGLNFLRVCFFIIEV
jgi:hypothetical protein